MPRFSNNIPLMHFHPLGIFSMYFHTILHYGSHHLECRHETTIDIAHPTSILSSIWMICSGLSRSVLIVDSSLSRTCHVPHVAIKTNFHFLESYPICNQTLSSASPRTVQLLLVGLECVASSGISIKRHSVLSPTLWIRLFRRRMCIATLDMPRILYRLARLVLLGVSEIPSARYTASALSSTVIHRGYWSYLFFNS